MTTVNWNLGLFSVTKEVRMPFGNLFEPKAYRDPKTGVSGEPKYGATLLIPPGPDLDNARKVLTNVANAKWGSPENWPALMKAGENWPIVDGAKLKAKAVAKGKNGDLYDGFAVLAARTKKQPKLAVLDGQKIITLETDAQKATYKGKFYNGCYVVAEVHFSTYDGFGGGINAYLQTIMWAKDGTPVGGSDPAVAFKEYMGNITNVDPTGTDSEIPF